MPQKDIHWVDAGVLVLWLHLGIISCASIKTQQESEIHSSSEKSINPNASLNTNQSMWLIDTFERPIKRNDMIGHANVTDIISLRY